MKVLLLIPSVILPEADRQGRLSYDRMGDSDSDRCGPVMDYHALANRLRKDESVDLLDYASVNDCTDPAVRLVHRLAGRDAALAVLGFRRRHAYDVVFTNGENVGIPLALLFKATRRRPGHITIGHRLSTGKKRLFFTILKAHRKIDRILLYATSQLEFARAHLGIPKDKLRLIAFHADQRFYRQGPTAPSPDQICSAGLEWRDYPTLIEAVRGRPNLSVKLAAASPWSKHASETEGRVLPANVDARRYDYHDLRDLYAASSVVVVPLYENDFQAGITTILEAMAMGKAIIATRTKGQTDAIIDGVNGILVPPGDLEALRVAIDRLLGDPALRKTLGESARAWLETHATLDMWVDNVVRALREACEV